MAKIWYAFFDSTPEDERLVLAEDWAKHNRSLFTDGIRNGGDCFEVKAGAGLSADVNGGIAVIQGYILNVEEDIGGKTVNVPLPAANPYNARVDRVVLRLDRRIEHREISVTYKMGTAGTGSPPALQRDSNIWELSLARVNVGAGKNSISQADIIDERFDTDLCGLINTLLRLDSSSWQTLVNQNISAQISLWNQTFNTELSTVRNNFDSVRAEFQTWFNQSKLNIALAAPFDFENVMARPNTTVKTTFSTNKIDLVATSNVSSKKIAEKSTVFNANGTMSVTEKVYDEASGTVIRSTVNTTTFNADNISEVVS